MIPYVYTHTYPRTALQQLLLLLPSVSAHVNSDGRYPLIHSWYQYRKGSTVTARKMTLLNLLVKGTVGSQGQRTDVLSSLVLHQPPTSSQSFQVGEAGLAVKGCCSTGWRWALARAASLQPPGQDPRAWARPTCPTWFQGSACAADFVEKGKSRERGQDQRQMLQVGRRSRNTGQQGVGQAAWVGWHRTSTGLELKMQQLGQWGITLVLLGIKYTLTWYGIWFWHAAMVFMYCPSSVVRWYWDSRESSSG